MGEMQFNKERANSIKILEKMNKKIDKNYKKYFSENIKDIYIHFSRLCELVNIAKKKNLKFKRMMYVIIDLIVNTLFNQCNLDCDGDQLLKKMISYYIATEIIYHELFIDLDTINNSDVLLEFLLKYNVPGGYINPAFNGVSIPIGLLLIKNLLTTMIGGLKDDEKIKIHIENNLKLHEIILEDYYDEFDLEKYNENFLYTDRILFLISDEVVTDEEVCFEYEEPDLEDWL